MASSEYKRRRGDRPLHPVPPEHRSLDHTCYLGFNGHTCLGMMVPRTEESLEILRSNSRERKS